jgi:zinc protease
MLRNIISGFILLLISAGCAKKVTDVSVSPDKAWRKGAPAPAAPRSIQLGEYTSFDLANGLKVIVVENHKLPRVSYQLSLNNDPLVEGEKAGYTSFAGDLMSKGTTSRTKSQIDEAIDYIGASMSTSPDGVFGSSLKKHSGKLLEIMTDVLYNPAFPEAEFEKIRKRAASNLVSAKTNPDAIASNIKSIVNYGAAHPYGEVQTEESIKNITVADCRKYYETYFKPNNAFLVIVGDVTPDEAKMQAEKYFGSWKPGEIPKTSYDMPAAPNGRRVCFGNKDGAVQSVINISYPVQLKPGADDAIKSSVMNSILGGGIFSGRLMQNLREKKAYTYGARSSLSTDKLVGNFNAFASVRNEVTDSAVTEFIYELERIVREPVSDADLSLAKSSMTGNFGRSLESPQTIASFALNTFRYNLPRDYYNNYLKNLDAVTVKDIQDMAVKYIKPDNCNIIVAGNKDNVADKLKKFDSDGKVEFFDPFGKIIEDAAIKLPEGLTAVEVVEDYLEAIGSKAKLKEIQSVKVVMKASMMGQEATFETVKTQTGKLAVKMSIGPMVLQEQRFDGVKGMQSQMGQKKVITEGPQLDEMKLQTKLFEQLDYSNKGYVLELKGVENIDGQNCYKLMVTNPLGSVSTEYYDMRTGYLVRSVSTQGEGERTMTITTDYKNYKEVGGVLIPHTTSISGAMPVPLVMEAASIEVNGLVDNTLFNIE